MTAREALELATDWADGRRSYTNLVLGFDRTDPAQRALAEQTVAILDAQEVVKWSALAQALLARDAMAARDA